MSEEKEIKPPIVIQPPRDWKKEEKLKAEEAKRKAIEVMKKTKIDSKKSKKTRKVYTVAARKVLPTHNLSESDSD